MTIILTVIIFLLLSSNVAIIWIFTQKIERLTTQFMVIKGTGSSEEAQVLWRSMKGEKGEKIEEDEMESTPLLDMMDSPSTMEKIFSKLPDSSKT